MSKLAQSVAKAVQELHAQLRTKRRRRMDSGDDEVDDDVIDQVIAESYGDEGHEQEAESTDVPATTTEGDGMATKRAKAKSASKSSAKKAAAKKSAKAKAAKGTKAAKVGKKKERMARAPKVTAKMLPATLTCTAVEKHGTRYIRLVFGDVAVSVMPVNLLGQDIDDMRDKLYPWFARVLVESV